MTSYAGLFSDFDFTSNNQYIASSSLDKTVRVWEIGKGICIRVIYGVSSQLCIRFHPVSINGVCVCVFLCIRVCVLCIKYASLPTSSEDSIACFHSWTRYPCLRFANLRYSGNVFDNFIL